MILLDRGVGGRRGSDLVLLWLWCRPAAVAPIRPLAWEPPCAAGATLKKKKKKRNLSQNDARGMAQDHSCELIYSGAEGQRLQEGGRSTRKM